MNQTKKLYMQFSGSCALLIAFFLGYVVKFYSHSHWLQVFDQEITDWIRYPITDFKIHFWKTMTTFGNTPTVMIITAIVVLVCLWKKQYLEAGYMALNMMVIAALANQALKYLFARPRPSIEHLVVAKGLSFPSGHAMGSLLCYGTLLIFVIYYVKNKPLKMILGILLGLLPFFVGCSRIFLGVHYPSDVLAGWLFSIAWLLLTYPIYRRRRFIKDFKGKG